MSLTRFRPSLLFVLLALLYPIPVFAESAPGDETGKGGFIIDSDTMEVSGERRTITFKGRVVTREDFILCSDELRVSYSEAKKIDEITALGHVRLFQGGRVATARKADYDREKRTLVFLGEPKISQCGDMVSGNKITYNMDTGSAVVEGGGGTRVRALMVPEKECVEEDIVEEDFCTGAR